MFELRSPFPGGDPVAELLGAIQRLQVKDSHVMLLSTRFNGYNDGAASEESCGDWLHRVNSKNGC